MKLIVILLSGLVLLMSGCMGSSVPANDVKPQATVAPTITAGDIRDIKQDIKQVQKTITTTNYALDSERAKIEKKRIRTAQVKDLSMEGVLAGFLILGWIAPAVVPKRYMVFGYLIALGIIIGSILIPFLWPF